MTDREVMQQALAALEDKRYVFRYTHIVDAIAALRTALAEQQAEPVAVVDDAIHAAWSAGYVEGEKAALEQTEQDWSMLDAAGRMRNE